MSEFHTSVHQTSAIFLGSSRNQEDLEVPVSNYSKKATVLNHRGGSPFTLLQLCSLITRTEISASSFQYATNRSALNRRKVPFFAFHSSGRAVLEETRRTLPLIHFTSVTSFFTLKET